MPRLQSQLQQRLYSVPAGQHCRLGCWPFAPIWRPSAQAFLMQVSTFTSLLYTC